MTRILNRILYFGAPFLILGIGVFALSTRFVYGPVTPETLDRESLIRLMQFRDFRNFSPDLLSRITDRAEAEFGRHSRQKPEFSFSPLEKRIYAYFQRNKSSRPSWFETNLMLMARTRYFQWMNDDETFSEEQRAALMRGVIDDMKYWESVYMDFLRAAELPIPTLAELIREFDRMIEGFKIGASAEETARIEAFKLKMNRAFVAKEMQGAVQNLTEMSDNVSSAVSNAFGSLLAPPKKKNREENSDSTTPNTDSGDPP